ncbi:MAG: hypothetical protein WBG89_02215 [Ornithinimicrobium sp.]
MDSWKRGEELSRSDGEFLLRERSTFDVDDFTIAEKHARQRPTQLCTSPLDDRVVHRVQLRVPPVTWDSRNA